MVEDADRLEREADEAEQRVGETQERAEEAARREAEGREIASDAGGEAPELEESSRPTPRRQ